MSDIFETGLFGPKGSPLRIQILRDHIKHSELAASLRRVRTREYRPYQEQWGVIPTTKNYAKIQNPLNWQWYLRQGPDIRKGILEQCQTSNKRRPQFCSGFNNPAKQF